MKKKYILFVLALVYGFATYWHCPKTWDLAWSALAGFAFSMGIGYSADEGRNELSYTGLACCLGVSSGWGLAWLLRDVVLV